MHRIDHATKLVDGNGTGKDGFTEGTPGTVAATRVTDDWLNDIQEEVCNTIEVVDTLVKGTKTQLSSTLRRMFQDFALNNWTKRTGTGSTNFVGAATDGTTVAIINSTNVEYSTNGINWTNVAVGSDNRKIAYGNGYWVIVGGSGTLYYATTPAGPWTSNPQGATVLRAVAYGNGYWVAAGNGGTLYYKATDPTGAWTLNTQGTQDIESVGYGNGYWVSAGFSATYYKATNPTGAWTYFDLGVGAGTTKSAKYGTVAGIDTWVLASTSGRIYTQASVPTGSWITRTCAVAGTINSVAIGDNIAVLAANVTSGSDSIYVWDGSSIKVQNSATAYDQNGVVYAFKQFISVGDTGDIRTSLKTGMLWD